MAAESSVSGSPAGSFIDDPLAHPLVRQDKRLSRDSSVLAIVPHYKCEAWLGDCLESLEVTVGQHDPAVDRAGLERCA